MRPPLSSARAWLQLLRAPNALTIPGQVLAGAALATSASPGQWPWSRLAAAAAAGGFLYLFGLLQNDLADLAEDRRDRPARPLPSGRVTLRAAQVAAWVCAGSGIGFAWAAGREAGWIGGLLLLLISLYNRRLKKYAGAGEIALGVCRGLLLALGACPVMPLRMFPLTVWAGAGLFTAYVAAVSAVARDETSGRPLSLALRALPLLALLSGIGFLGIAPEGADLSARHLAIGILLTLVPLRCLLTGGAAGPRPALVGALLGHLLPMQAALIVWTAADRPRLGLALVLAALTPAYRRLSRRIAAS